MLGYTCAKCGRELRCERNEVYLVHFIDDDRKLGIDVMRISDLWGCAHCGLQVVLGMGGQMFGYDMSAECHKKIMDSGDRVIEVKRF